MKLVVTPGITSTEYELRRTLLARKLPSNSIVLLAGRLDIPGIMQSSLTLQDLAIDICAGWLSTDFVRMQTCSILQASTNQIQQ